MNAPEPLAAAAQAGFDWQACWHPIAFCADLSAAPPDRPIAFSIHDEPFVLFRDGDGVLRCLQDRCPHRMAQLSAGRVVGGRLECGYHGWQFNGSGACEHIPQLAPGHAMPARACVPSRAVVEAQGLVWVWSGDPAAARPEAIPRIPALDEPGVVHVDYATDLPYDQGYLIENVIDVTHIHIAHDGMRGGGHRHLALPLEFDLLEEGPQGLAATYRSIVPGRDPAHAPLASALLEFRAPGLIHYTSRYRNAARIAGLALYALPLGAGRCRLLYRKYSNFYSWRERIKPRWLEHWTQNTILRQDMDLIVGQYAATERSGRELRDLWLPLKSSDPLVIRYRQWLDRHAPPGAPYRGFSSHASPPGAPASGPAPDTFTLHTRHCATCQRALRTARVARGAALGLAALLLPALPLASSAGARVGLAAAYLVALLAALACHRFARRFA
jgi:phenylpropionate dioxygenase-like ring-hydroxylating dioxygenase large terminal subunit